MNNLYDANFDQDAEYWDAVEAAATAPVTATKEILTGALLLLSAGVKQIACEVLTGQGTVAAWLILSPCSNLWLRRESDNKIGVITDMARVTLTAEDAALCEDAQAQQLYRRAAEADTRRRNREVELFAQHQVNRAKHWNRGSLAIGGR